MKSTTENDRVSADELGRRISEFRRLGVSRNLPAQVVYQEPYVECPWPGCGMRINAIQFHLDNWPDLEMPLLGNLVAGARISGAVSQLWPPCPVRTDHESGNLRPIPGCRGDSSGRL